MRLASALWLVVLTACGGLTTGTSTGSGSGTGTGTSSATATSAETSAAAASACASLVTCCATLVSPGDASECTRVVALGDAMSCAEALADFEGDGLCGAVSPPGSGTGGRVTSASCSALGTCCMSLTPADQVACNDLVSAGDAAECSEELASYMAGGLCD